MKNDLKNTKRDIQEESFAMEILKDYKAQTKRQFIIICVLIGIIALFVGGLVYFITNYDVEYGDTIEKAGTTNGSACIGNNCANGYNK